MNARSSLTTKILIWFSLNLIVLIVIAWAGLRYATRSGFDSFLAGHVGGRVESTARAIIGELEGSPRSEWNEVLARYGRKHGVLFLLLDPDQAILAGEQLQLPESLRSQLPRPARHEDGQFRRNPPPGGFGERGARGPRSELEGDNLGLPPRPPDSRGGPPPNGPGGNRRPPMDGEQIEPARGSGPVEVPGSAPIHHRFLVQSDNPRAYWVGLMLALRPGVHGGHQRATLLARSATFSAGGFFFDYRPWLLSCAGIVGLSGLFWFPLIRGVTRSVGQMTRATRQIADGQFDVRVDETRTDELGQLGVSINRMSARLEGFVNGQKRSTGDLAHELCSPLARLQMSVGILEQNCSEQQKPCLEDVREEVQHLSDLVNELLVVSKASLKPANIKRKLTNIKAIAKAAAKREAADETDVLVQVPAELTCLASPELLQRALANLIRNALRYAGSAGPITITARAVDSAVVISVSDLGPGVPPQHLDRIFDAFYRLEPDRARDTGGAGLGLAIVKTCIEGCGGTVTAKNREPHGLEVQITLPVE
ncbi:MAG: sensor histidine kinase [Verrucomicrobia bacterium]|nr:sensor histidine kinase [Verrucomicrobiota bacterium]NBU07562.1 sensor histidine kinase [Pseudomonadota bacterium]NDB76493.1 sensor histidine kinase [Verrucomicrobiota bacterium]NDE99656.1 sensor histidine kinase [Verrucomicrobiota bacterium]